MRFLIRVLLLPVRIGLFVLLLPCKFICLFGTMLLSILSFLLFVISLCVFFFLGEHSEGLQIMFLAYVISPYGLPVIASLIIEGIEKLSETMGRI